MKKLRSRLALYLTILVIISGVMSLLLSAMGRNGMILNNETVKHLMFGFAFRDMLLIFGASVLLIAALMLTTRSATNPVRQINRAVKEITGGNYDVRLDLKDRVEEFGELQKNFNCMAQELKSNEYLRKDFISSVSHELKTPLSIMGGYAKLLEEGGLTPEEQKEYAHLIAEQSERLVTLTGNMLRLSRIDHQEIKTKSTLFSLDEQIRQAVLLLEPKWTALGLNMELELQTVDYSGDEELMAQVWINLLDNAVKFNRKGGQVSVLLAKDAGGVAVTVSDTGIGMEPGVLSRAFEQFYRAGGAAEGSGLGLPLVRRIVELHGGEVSAQSAPGEGSVFTVKLPV